MNAYVAAKITLADRLMEFLASPSPVVRLRIKYHATIWHRPRLGVLYPSAINLIFSEYFVFAGDSEGVI